MNRHIPIFIHIRMVLVFEALVKLLKACFFSQDSNHSEHLKGFYLSPLYCCNPKFSWESVLFNYLLIFTSIKPDQMQVRLKRPFKVWSLNIALFLVITMPLPSYTIRSIRYWATIPLSSCIQYQWELVIYDRNDTNVAIHVRRIAHRKYDQTHKVADVCAGGEWTWTPIMVYTIFFAEYRVCKRHLRGY